MKDLLPNGFRPVGVFLARISSVLFSNLKIVWIVILFVEITNISNSIQAINANSNCKWYWGNQILNYFDDDQYLRQITIEENGNQDSSKFSMTCPFHSCLEVLPTTTNSTTTFSWSAETINYSGSTFCIVNFRFLKYSYVFAFLALVADSLIQFFIGCYMLYSQIYQTLRHKYPPKFGYCRNLHIRSIYYSLYFLARPGRFILFLNDLSPSIYPALPPSLSDPVPYYFSVMCSVLVDLPYAFSSVLWVLASGSPLSIYLALASCLNAGLSFLWVYVMQCLEDLDNGREQGGLMVLRDSLLEEQHRPEPSAPPLPQDNHSTNEMI